jgi:malate dehydrogenase (oxaloacetate-decarboxylating)(NADP+)
VVFAEGEEPKIVRAARIAADEGMASPVLLGSREAIERAAAEYAIPLHDIDVVDIASSPLREKYARYLWERRQRKGLSLGEAHQRVYNANYFGSCMVACGDADAMLSGVNATYPETIRPALEAVGAHPKAGILSGMYMLVFDKRVVFCGDTTVNIDPNAEQLAQIALRPRASCARSARSRAWRCCRSRTSARCATRPRQGGGGGAAGRAADPSLVVDGEMQADTALDERVQRERYPFGALRGEANVLIFPNLSAGNIAYKLLTTSAGPRPSAHPRRDEPPRARARAGADVQDIVNMAASR